MLCVMQPHAVHVALMAMLPNTHAKLRLVRYTPAALPSAPQAWTACKAMCWIGPRVCIRAAAWLRAAQGHGIWGEAVCVVAGADVCLGVRQVFGCFERLRRRLHMCVRFWAGVRECLLPGAYAGMMG